MKPWPLLLLFWIAAAQAHEVHYRIEAAGATVITLTYANGEPFAYEKYALYPAGVQTPRQVGNTDARGRIAFVPGETRQWRVQATSGDGHGVDLEFTAPEVAAPAAATPAETLSHWLRAGCGLALIFGLFGLFQLFTRKKP